MTEVSRYPGADPKDAGAERIALALMGAGVLVPEAIAEAARWDRPEGGVTGRAAILAAAARQSAERIAVEQVVTHGRTGSVLGRVTRGGSRTMFCHVIRYTSPAATEIAQLVSFEHPESA